MNLQYHQPILPGETYYLFSRAIGFEKLFVTEDNYRFFLEKFFHHVSPVADLYTYTMLPNHFHLLARIKPAEEFADYFQYFKQKPIDHATDLPDFIAERFSNWLNSYTKSFNKVYKRRGSLFLDRIKRSRALTDKDFCNFLFYVHKNAVHHNYTKAIGHWAWDGYKELISSGPTQLLRNEVLQFFGSHDAFIKFHDREIIIKPGDWEDV
jgi:REP element-mobilizing transposase RayT